MEERVDIGMIQGSSDFGQQGYRDPFDVEDYGIKLV